MADTNTGVLLLSAATTGAGRKYVTGGGGSYGIIFTLAATISAFTLDLEASMDGGTTWFSMDSHAATAGEITANGGYYALVNRPAPLVRFNIKTYTGSGTATCRLVEDK